MLKYILIALFVASAYAGVVSPVDRCGGGGTPVELRIEGCSGPPPCTFIAETNYLIEGDFIPHHSSNSVNLKLTIIVGGIQMVVLDEPVEGEINAGQMYTIDYNIAPTSLLVGQRINIELQVYHTGTEIVEICLSAPGIIE